MHEIYIDHFDLRAIAASGQCFRLREVRKDRFELVAAGSALAVERLGAGHYGFDCSAEAYETLWKPYFDLDTDYAGFIAAIDPQDAFLTKAAEAGCGIRILRQDPWEMLVTFIISQRKNIPAIAGSVQMLCERYGEPIPLGEETRFAFPTPDALARCGEEELRECSLGYRCAYIRAAAQLVQSGRLELPALRTLSDARLHEALLAVPGVGPKVANCVMLFGFHRIAAFPRDVWINRIVQEAYGGSFPLERYEGFAGVLQQYMFYYARTASSHRLMQWPGNTRAGPA